MPAAANNKRFKKGLLLHRLLEVLPAVPHNQRHDKATAFLRHSGAELSAKERQELLSKALLVLETHPDLYQEGYMPEVAMLGRTQQGQRLKGRVDYVRVTATKVVIVDYKTDAHPPKTLPPGYKEQLAAYRQVAQGIWPDKKIVCGVLWVSATPPRLDKVNDAD